MNSELWLLLCRQYFLWNNTLKSLQKLIAESEKNINHYVIVYTPSWIQLWSETQVVDLRTHRCHRNKKPFDKIDVFIFEVAIRPQGAGE